MGFVYNNVWESYCKTFLELNGYFVLTNTFVSLLDEEEGDARRRKVEADLIATRLTNTNLGGYLLDIPQEQGQEILHRFSAGILDRDPLIYGEVRANLSRQNDQQLIDELFDERGDEARINRKLDRIEQRFNVRPTVVIFAYNITGDNLQRIHDRGWKYKLFPDMMKFIRSRFQAEMVAKHRVQYNDPWLEFMRFVNRLEMDGRLEECFGVNPPNDIP